MFMKKELNYGFVKELACVLFGKRVKRICSTSVTCILTLRFMQMKLFGSPLLARLVESFIESIRTRIHLASLQLSTEWQTNNNTSVTYHCVLK